MAVTWVTCLQAHEMVGQVKARLAVSERELTLARQEAEGSSRSGTAQGQELHAVKRQSAALQQQLTSLQAELEETLAKHQSEVRGTHRNRLCHLCSDIVQRGHSGTACHPHCMQTLSIEDQLPAAWLMCCSCENSIGL